MKKTLTVLLALVLVIAMSVAGTMAYLTSTDTVTNTFTVGNVAITLDEAAVDEYGVATDAPRTNANEYRLIPGHNYLKDPTIHVAANSEDCYLFVKVVNGIEDYEATGDTTIAAQMAAKGWKVVDANKGIYVYAKNTDAKTVVAAESDVPVFANFTIADNAQLPENGTGLDVVVTAYAVQADGFADMAAADIWTTAGFAST